MLQNPGYYEALKQTSFRYPHPGPTELEKDLSRTGSDISPDEITMMRNILRAFLLRNPTVGYC